jgi:hypothetical protein
MELSCKQCGKRTSTMCARSDCWNTEKNLAVETARRAKEVAAESRDEQKLAVLQFPQNFDAVAAWAERIGAQRKTDRDAVRRMAKETVYSAMVYAAIARSL